MNQIHRNKLNPQSRLKTGKLLPKASKIEDSLRETIRTLTELYEREKESRCCFQLERDKLCKMREIDREKFNNVKCELAILQDKLLSFEQWHLKESLHINKKIKYLISERDMKLNELKLELEEKSKENLAANLDERKSFLDGIRDSMNSLKQINMENDEIFRHTTLVSENRISEAIRQNSEIFKNLVSIYESRHEAHNDAQELLARNAIHEITEFKNQQIGAIKSSGQKSYEELRDYFKDLIKFLMGKIGELNKQNESLRRHLDAVMNKLCLAETDLISKDGQNKELIGQCKSFASRAQLFKSSKKLFDSQYAELKELKKKYHSLDIEYELLLAIKTNLVEENEYFRDYLKNLVEKFRDKFENLTFLSNEKFKIK